MCSLVVESPWLPFLNQRTRVTSVGRRWPGTQEISPLMCRGETACRLVARKVDSYSVLEQHGHVLVLQKGRVQEGTHGLPLSAKIFPQSPFCLQYRASPPSSATFEEPQSTLSLAFSNPRSGDFVPDKEFQPVSLSSAPTRALPPGVPGLPRPGL